MAEMNSKSSKKMRIKIISRQSAKQQDTTAEGPTYPGPSTLISISDTALLLTAAQGLQDVLDSMQSVCAANGLIIGVAQTKAVVFRGACLSCTKKIAGQDLKSSQSFTYLDLLLMKIDTPSMQFAPADSTARPMLDWRLSSSSVPG